MAISNKLVRPNLFAVGDTTQKGNGPLNAKGISGDQLKQMKSVVNNSLTFGSNPTLLKSDTTYPILKKISKYQGILQTTLHWQNGGPKNVFSAFYSQL